MRTRPLTSFAIAIALGIGTAAAAQPPHARHTSRTLTPFGSDAAFLAYLEDARTEAHRRGRWWYAARRIQYAQAGRSDSEPSPAPEDDEEPDFTPHRGLEVIPGSHGEYDVEEVMLDDGSELFYSTLQLTQIRPGVEVVWPGMRRRGRVRAGDEPGGDVGILWDAARQSPLYSLASIYRPVRDTLEPTVHAITICPPRSMLLARPRGCRTTAFVGPRGGELVVTRTHAFVWTVPDYGDLEALQSEADCAARAAALNASGLPSQVYRLPLAGGRLEVLGTRGAPAWGSGFLAGEGRLRALVAWPDIRCDDSNRGNLTTPPARLNLLDAPLSLFARRLAEVPAANESELPAALSAAILVRFAGDWLLYGELAYEFSVPWQEEANQSAQLFAVPIGRPREVRTIAVPHSLVAIEPAGGRVLLTGYRNNEGLEVSVLDLGAGPRIVSAVRIEGRKQRAGFSGRFRTTVRRDGSVLIALPTARIDEPAGEEGFRTEAAELRYILVDRSGQARLVERGGR